MKCYLFLTPPIPFLHRAHKPPSRQQTCAPRTPPYCRSRRSASSNPIRPKRLASEITLQLGGIIEDTFSHINNLSGLVTVQSVDLSPDLRNARVSIKIEAEESAKKEALSLMRNFKKSLRYELAQRMRGLRGVPDLWFVEETESEVERTLGIIDRLERERVEREGSEGGVVGEVGEVVQGLEIGIESLRGEGIIEEDEDEDEEGEGEDDEDERAVVRASLDDEDVETRGGAVVTKVWEEEEEEKGSGNGTGVETHQGTVVTKVWDPESDDEGSSSSESSGSGSSNGVQVEMRGDTVVTKVWDVESEDEIGDDGVEMRHGAVVTKVWEVAEELDEHQVTKSNENGVENDEEDEDEECRPGWELVEIIHTGDKSTWEYQPKAPADSDHWVTKVWDADDPPPT